MITERNAAVAPKQLPVASILLDAVRAVAALLVCLEHWRNLLFVDFDQVKRPTAPLKALYVSGAAGHQAVVVFFVLSGYLVGGSVMRATRFGTWSWSDYLVWRLVRLWVVLIPALCLGALCDGIGLSFQLAPALYAGRVPNHMIADLSGTFTPAAFVGNVVFLQTILVAPFGSNGALWSLANEFWYYLLFPLIVLIFYRTTRPIARLLCACVAVAIAALIGKEILLGFLIWLLGVCLYAAPRRQIGVGIRWVATGAYTASFFALCLASRGKIPLPGAGGFVGDFILAVLTALFLWTLIGAGATMAERSGVKLVRSAAKGSYSLYLVHTPLLVLLTAILAGNGRWQPDARHLAVGTVMLPVVLFYAAVLAFATEYRTDAVRDWVRVRMLLSKT